MQRKKLRTIELVVDELAGGNTAKPGTKLSKRVTMVREAMRGVGDPVVGSGSLVAHRLESSLREATSIDLIFFRGKSKS